MRILLAHNSYQQTGGEDVVFALEAALLRGRRHNVIEYIDHNHRIREMGTWEAAINTVWSHASRERLARVLSEAKPKVAHFHNTFLMISPAGYYSCRDAGVPVVQTLHNYRLLCPAATLFRKGNVCEDCHMKTPPWPGVLHRCYRDSVRQTLVVATMLTLHRWMKTWQEQVDVYVALTDFARTKFIEAGLPADKVAIKPNFIHPDPGVGMGRGHYALFVGRLSTEKGIRTLVQAWQELGCIPLRIVGSGILSDGIRRVVETRGLDQVDLLGRLPRKQVLGLMREARFLVFPSQWYEGFPMAIVEAFACGVPVIASRLGGMAEIIADGCTGLHFKPGNPEDLAAKVAWAWNHPQEMEEMGKMARREYEAKYTAGSNYEQLMTIYERAVGSHT